jgi:phage baseplate assembly protein W
MTVYRDLSFDLEKDQFDDLDLKEDAEAVKQAIKNVVLTGKGHRSRFQNPYYGSRIYRFMFEKFDPLIAVQIEDEIENSIEAWEPRVKLINVSASADIDNHTYNISIMYRVININIVDELQLTLEVIK